jgi:hypothetical protein
MTCGSGCNGNARSDAAPATGPASACGSTSCECVKIKPNHPAKPLAAEQCRYSGHRDSERTEPMKTLKIGAAFAALLAMGAPIAAYASTAHNIVLV